MSWPIHQVVKQTRNSKDLQGYPGYSILLYYIVLYYILLLSIIIYFSFSPGQCKCTPPFITLSNWTKIIRLTSEGFKFALRVSDVPYSFANVNKKCIAVPGLVENKDPKDLKWFLSLCRCIGDIQYANDMDTHMFSFV